MLCSAISAPGYVPGEGKTHDPEQHWSLGNSQHCVGRRLTRGFERMAKRRATRYRALTSQTPGWRESRPPNTTHAVYWSRCFELKAEDESTWYRVIYLARIENTVYVLDSFIKKSRKTEKNDLNRAKARLSKVRQRLQKEKSDAKGKGSK